MFERKEDGGGRRGCCSPLGTLKKNYAKKSNYEEVLLPPRACAQVVPARQQLSGHSTFHGSKQGQAGSA